MRNVVLALTELWIQSERQETRDQGARGEQQCRNSLFLSHECWKRTGVRDTMMLGGVGLSYNDSDGHFRKG